MVEMADTALSSSPKVSVHPQHRHIVPSPVRVRQSPSKPLTPAKRVASQDLELILDHNPKKRLFQEHLQKEPPKVHFQEVDLGGLHLRNENNIARDPSREEYELLLTAFPGATGIGGNMGFLTVVYDTLPPKPWPVALAGLPVHISTEHFAQPLPLKRPGGHKRIFGEIDARGGASKVLFTDIINYFRDELNVSIQAIANIAVRWEIRVPDDTILSNLPCMIAKTLATYIFEHEVDEPMEAALRGKRPDGLIWDTTLYNDLRPGVMLSSGRVNGQGPELLTTSGIQVSDDKGNKFITVASHGFPGNLTSVYHPNADGDIIGYVRHKIPDSDIALVELLPSKSYQNETYTGYVAEGMIEGVTIKGIRKKYMSPGDNVSMENPFSGYHDGVYMGPQLKRIPADEASVEHHWLEIAWLWLGNGIEPVNGSCGSVILDEDGNVVSFFRFLADKYPGCGLGVAASTLEEHGYYLV